MTELPLQAILIQALNAAANAIVITDAEPRILWANTAFSTLTGYPLEESIGCKPAELVKSGRQDPLVYQQMWKTILNGEVWRGELINKRKDGGYYDEEITITPVCAVGDTVSHYIAVKHDISARKSAERNLRESEAYFRLFYEHAPVAYQSLDMTGRILEVNPAWLRQLGYPREGVIGRLISEFLAPGQDALLQHNFSNFLNSGSVSKIEYDLLHRDSSVVNVSVDGLIERDSLGKFKKTHCVLHNISAHKRMEKKLRHLASTDALTGLANRRQFLEQMVLVLARHLRHGTPTALLMLDLDWFKQVNDNHGHAAGDAVLKHYAKVIQASLRNIDLLGRLGGEEFGILLPDTDSIGAYEFAERIRHVAAEQPARLQAKEIAVTFSIGVATFMRRDPSTDVILARADHAIYRAKANGRDISTVSGGTGINIAEDGTTFWGPVDNDSSRAKASGKLLSIDQFECISCGTCVEQTDKVYVLPDDGKASPIAQDGPMDLIQDAIDACPVTCISWVTPDEAEERGLATGVER